MLRQVQRLRDDLVGHGTSRGFVSGGLGGFRWVQVERRHEHWVFAFTSICIHFTYLEPKWPLFLKVNSPEQGRTSNQNKGHLGSRYIHIEVEMLTYAHKQNACAEQICDGFYFLSVWTSDFKRYSIYPGCGPLPVTVVNEGFILRG